MSKVEIVCAHRKEDYVSYQCVDIDSYFSINDSVMSGGAVEGEKALAHSFLMDTLRKVMGKTLTIIDASIHDKTQNKAIKDLLRGVISDEMSFAGEMAFNQESFTKIIEDNTRGMSEEEIVQSSVSVEEVLGVK